MKLHRTVRVQVAPIALPTDQVALDRGAYLYNRGAVPRPSLATRSWLKLA
jgi:hypothetical protein